MSGTICGTIADHAGSGRFPARPSRSSTKPPTIRASTVSDERGNFQVTNLQPGSYTVRVEMPSFRTLERKNVVLSAGERLSVGTARRSKSAASARRVVVEARGTPGQRRRDAAQRRHHREADRTGAGARPRRHVDHAAAAGRALREHRRLARHELRHRRAERRRRAPRLEQRHRRRRRRQRGRRQQPHGAADQPRRDRRSHACCSTPTARSTDAPAAARCRSSARAAASNYHGNLYYYGRHENLNATNFFTNRANAAKPRYRFNTYGANLGGPVPKARQEAVLLLLDRSAARQPPGPAAQLDDADRRARCRATSRRRSTRRGA